jgi:hypothetical protein
MTSDNMIPVEPPYRIEVQGIGIGPEPPKFPVKVQRTTPGYSGEICTADEVAMWRYVEHLEARVRELCVEVRGDAADDTACKATQDSAAVALMQAEHLTNPHSGGPQARAQTANAPDAAEIPSDTAERAMSDAGANGAVLEKPTTNAPETEATAGTLRERVIRSLLADATQTNGSIAQTCDCSDEYVRLRRRELEAEGQLSPVPVRRADGTLYSRCGAE